MQGLDSTRTTYISIVVPCYNEEVSLPKFLEEITQTMQGVKHHFNPLSLSMMAAKIRP